MAYYVWLHQTNNGCDYTIGCGQKLLRLRAATRAEVEPEVRQIIEDRGAADSRQYADRALQEVVLFELVENMTPLLIDMKHEDAFRREEEAKAEKLEQFERLKAELGK